jgi:hypothetical protein
MLTVAGIIYYIFTAIPPTSIILIAAAIRRTARVITHDAPPSIDACICGKKI